MARSERQFRDKLLSIAKSQLPSQKIEPLPGPGREVRIGDLGHIWFDRSNDTGIVYARRANSDYPTESFRFGMEDDTALTLAVGNALNALLHPGEV